LCYKGNVKKINSRKIEKKIIVVRNHPSFGIRIEVDCEFDIHQENANNPTVVKQIFGFTSKPQ